MTSAYEATVNQMDFIMAQIKEYDRSGMCPSGWTKETALLKLDDLQTRLDMIEWAESNKVSLLDIL